MALARQGALGLARQLTAAASTSSSIASGGQRWHGGGVPEYWGRDSPYHPGTEFLGTPKNHLELVAKRPLSPHVFEITGMQPHYKFPIGAVSSIANRVSAVMLSVGAGAAGYIALTGDLGAAVAAFKDGYPLLVFPAKAAVSFPLIYHYLAGLRHFYWDHYKYGKQVDKDSPLEVPAVESSSKMVIGASVALAAFASVYSV
eukprot:scaffold2.g6792.t1